MTIPNINDIFPIVREAGEIILSAAKNRKSIQKKGDADFVTDTDFAVQGFVRDRLSSLCPEIGFLGEENDGGADLSVESTHEYIWVLDPVDGTMNFIRDIPHFSVSLALVRGGETLFGVVYDPSKDEMFHATLGGGAYLGEEKIHVSDVDKLENALVGFGTAPYQKPESAECFEIHKNMFLSSVDLRRLGSSAIDICYIAAGRLEAYYEYRLSIWDYAAARLILSEAGGRLTNFGNIPTKGERKSPVLASNALLHDALLYIINN